MAVDTNKRLKHNVIYSVYVRNYGKMGTFKEVEEDLDRIKKLGVDIIWLMPIHPIGVKNKKGSLGCPYSIKDYRKVNPEYGTLEDFKSLLNAIHEKEMKCIIDVVYNHTSHDSWLVENHPEYFYRRKDGSFGNRAGDWSDVIDLNYENKDLWDYQIETLKYWASIGVDGFRCDVASMVPVSFWGRAREEVAKINKDTIWLAESVHLSFLKALRKEGIEVHSDGELYQAFDILYDYDVNEEFNNYFNGKGTLKAYIDKLSLQEGIYPNNYIKLRFLENHDQERAAKKIKDFNLLKIWTKFIYFQKGTVLIYNGQEALEEKTPSLFDLDKINFNNINEELVYLFRSLYNIKKDKVFSEGYYEINILSNKEVVAASYEMNNQKLYGIFNFGKKDDVIELEIKDGEYLDLVENKKIVIQDNKLLIGKEALIFKVK
ncbi:MAG: alpha-amylase [Clostridiales bacterium]|nr:alpha-amylase [Clostridiales bacterium]